MNIHYNYKRPELPSIKRETNLLQFIDIIIVFFVRIFIVRSKSLVRFVFGVINQTDCTADFASLTETSSFLIRTEVSISERRIF